MARKTIEVAKVRDTINEMIEYSWRHHLNTGEAGRYSLGIALESILHDTGNYKGFKYLDGHEAVIANEYDESSRRYF